MGNISLYFDQNWRKVMEFALVGQQKFEDLPLETKIEVYKWEKWLQPDPNYTAGVWTFGDIIYILIFFLIIIAAMFSGANKNK